MIRSTTLSFIVICTRLCYTVGTAVVTPRSLSRYRSGHSEVTQSVPQWSRRGHSVRTAVVTPRSLSPYCSGHSKVTQSVPQWSLWGHSVHTAVVTPRSLNPYRSGHSEWCELISLFDLNNTLSVKFTTSSYEKLQSETSADNGFLEVTGFHRNTWSQTVGMVRFGSRERKSMI